MGMPEWVQIWAFMRLRLNDYRQLPMQGGDNMISDAEYDQIKSQWVAAGSPKFSTTLLEDAFQAERQRG